MTSDPGDAGGLGCFFYRSTAAAHLRRRDLDDILLVARARNLSLSLTGCLHYEDGMFFQWLEGPSLAVGQVVASIRADPRHRDLTVLGEGPVDLRLFRDWSMRFSGRDDASLMDWIARSNSSTVDRQGYAGGILSFLMSVPA